MNTFLRYCQCLLLICLYSCERIINDSIIPVQYDSAEDEAEQLYTLGDSMYFKKEYSRAIAIYHESLRAIPDNSTSSLKSNVNNDIGLCYKLMSEFDSAIYYYDQALELDSKRADTIQMAGRMRNLGIAYSELGLISRALEYYLEAQNLLQVSYPLRNAQVQINIGNVYLQEDEFFMALSSYKSAFDHISSSGQRKKMYLLYNNLGYTYFKMKSYDSAEYYLKKVINNFDESTKNTFCHALDNMGLLYMEIGKWDSAKFYLAQSYKIYQSELMRYGMADNELIMADYYRKVLKFDQSKEKVFSALSYAEEVKSIPLVIRSYETLIQIFRDNGEFMRASNFQNELQSLKDSEYQEQRDKANEVRHNYILAREKKEKDIAKAKTKLALLLAERRRFYLITLFFFLVLVSFATVIIFRQKTKLTKVNEELARQNAKIDVLNRQNFHFTKNSLTGVVGMLNKQFKYVKDPKILSFLLEERLRMETVNVLYKQVFNNSSGFINLRSFLTSIIDNTTISFFDENELLTIVDVADDIELPNEKAFPLGLVINEICVNACKYGSSTNNLELKLDIVRAGSEELKIIFSDKGPGFPKDFDWKESNSFGLTLIKLFVEELSGQLQILSSTVGVIYDIKINFQR